MRSRAGGETSAICIGPVPLGPPVAGGVGATVAVMTLVAPAYALADPSLLLAITRTRMLKPTSAATTRYVLLVALGITLQFEGIAAATASAGQRSQRYAIVIGQPDQVPFVAVSVLCRTGVPRMLGAALFCGTTCDCAEPVMGNRAAASATTAASGNASRSARWARLPFPLE